MCKTEKKNHKKYNTDDIIKIKKNKLIRHITSRPLVIVIVLLSQQSQQPYIRSLLIDVFEHHSMMQLDIN